MQNWEDFYFYSRDNLKLYARKYGWHLHAPKTVVCLPGLTRNSADFDELADFLANHPKAPCRVVSLDFRGRGNSAYDREWNNYNPIQEAEDTVACLTALDVAHGNFVGTSRGGLVTMLLAASRPGSIQSVVLNDVGPEIDATGLVRIKSYMERVRPAQSRAEARDGLKAYMSAQFPKFDDPYWDLQVDKNYQERDGTYVARYDPKLLNTLKAINLDAPLATLWPQFAGLKANPLMLVRGMNTDLLSKGTVSKMQQMRPDMKVIDVPDQGHAPDLGTAGLPQRIHQFITNV